MKSRHYIWLLGALLVVQAAFGREERPLSDQRLAFLMGMTSFTGSPPLIAIFPPEDHPSYEVFDRVAKQYAEDIGISADATGGRSWRSVLSAALVRHYRDEVSHTTIEGLFGASASRNFELHEAYLAGAYYGFGRSHGFRLTNYGKGLYIVQLTRIVFSGLVIEATLNPGIPGNIVITLCDSAEQKAELFIRSMEMRRAKLSSAK